jgi:subtilisin
MRGRLLLVVCALSVGLAAAGNAAAGTIPGQYIVVLRAGADSDAVARTHARSANAEVFQVYRRALNGYAARLSASGLRAVRSDPRVLLVSQDRAVHALAQSMPTGVERIDGEASSARAGDGAGSVGAAVAVLDTGIDTTHPDLNVVGGKNCSTGKSYTDGNGHGTHVAGTIGAKDDANGVVGVVPGARLYAVRVLNNAGSGSWSSIVCGIDWVTANAAATGIKVANMSLGGSGSDGGCSADALHRAICNSTAAGVTYVVAAGNSGADLKGFVPAAFDEVLSVTAVADFDGAPGGLGAPTCRDDVDETAADFSNYATTAADRAHTIAAPGACILSTWKSGGYNTISGTSMASPHMAGTAALCIATGACTGSPATVISKLRADAETYNNANAGYGFDDDPLRAATAARYYGYLTRAGGY